MSRILVTGATTPVGRELVKELLTRPAVQQVVAVARPGEEPDPSHDDQRHVVVASDLTRARSLRNLLYREAADVDTVIHMAAHRSLRQTGRRAHRLNVEATRDLLGLSEDHPKIAHFVYVSSGAVYRVDGHLPDLLDEEQPLALSPAAPQWLRDRIEADLTVCTRMGMSPLRIQVLRAAECLAPDMGSQLYDYLNAPICFRPLGFDPVLNVISLRDLVRAIGCAMQTAAPGVFNIPGRDTLTLRQLIARWGRRGLPAPGLSLAPLYGLRALVTGAEFRYDMNAWRFHHNGILAGERAERILGYAPRFGVDWPVGGALPPAAAVSSARQGAALKVTLTP